MNQPRVVAVVEVDSGQLGVDSAMAELQQLQNALTTPERNNLIAIVSLTEMVVLKPALDQFGRWDAEDHRKRVEQLIARMKRTDSCVFACRWATILPGQAVLPVRIVRRARP
ncbi:hypothetical protein ACNKHK_00985 [Shigella flexneri]